MELTLDQKDLERLIGKAVPRPEDYRGPTVKLSGDASDGTLTAVCTFKRVDRDPRTGRTVPTQEEAS